MSAFEEQYYDVLKDIERAIAATYRGNPDLTDRNVDKALSGLQRFYSAALKGRNQPKLRLSKPEQSLFDAVQQTLENHMRETLTVNEAVQCIKRIHKSVVQWVKMRSDGTYLDFVTGYNQDA